MTRLDAVAIGDRVGQTTITESAEFEGTRHTRVEPVPGLVLLFSNRSATLRSFRVEPEPLTLGRLELSDPEQPDSMISRAHVEIAWEGGTWRVRDLGSRNGTFVAGQKISAETHVTPGTLIRVGGAILLASADILPFRQLGVKIREGEVAGPALHAALEQVAQLQRLGVTSSLLVTGESGSGKELAAKTFHRSGPHPSGPFTAVNCATIPKDLAERLLFGARRGAFSGATDASGYVHSAHGGTLFLDEIGELPLDVQSKLLRLLETKQVMRLGSTQYESVDVRIVAATWRDLRGQVAAERFREDLYFRIGQPEVRLPPLRERIEEIPWHIQQTLTEAAPGLSVSATFVEACALRAWPGNVRELRAEVRRAAAAALTAGAQLLGPESLSATAGIRIPGASDRPLENSGEKRPSAPSYPEDDYAAALAAESGNVSRAAVRLGVHRSKVRRWLERYDVSAEHFKR